MDIKKGKEEKKEKKGEKNRLVFLHRVIPPKLTPDSR